MGVPGGCAILAVRAIKSITKDPLCYAPINVSPHPPTRDRVRNFPCLEWQACPRGRDIESLKCACETHAAHVQFIRFEFLTLPGGGGGN